MIPMSVSFQASREEWTDEDICNFHIHMARQQYERDIKPWVDRLLRLKHMEIPRHTVFLPNDQGQPAATEPAKQAGRGPLGCADLLDSEPVTEK